MTEQEWLLKKSADPFLYTRFLIRGHIFLHTLKEYIIYFDKY